MIIKAKAKKPKRFTENDFSKEVQESIREYRKWASERDRLHDAWDKATDTLKPYATLYEVFSLAMDLYNDTNDKEYKTGDVFRNKCTGKKYTVIRMIDKNVIIGENEKEKRAFGEGFTYNLNDIEKL